MSGATNRIFSSLMLAALPFLLASECTFPIDPPLHEETLGPFTIRVSLVGKRRVDRTRFEYDFWAAITYSGADPGHTGSAVTAAVASGAESTEATDPIMEFGDVLEGQEKRSIDTVTLIHDRRFPFDWSTLAWTACSETTLNKAISAEVDGWQPLLHDAITMGYETIPSIRLCMNTVGEQTVILTVATTTTSPGTLIIRASTRDQFAFSFGVEDDGSVVIMNEGGGLRMNQDGTVETIPPELGFATTASAPATADCSDYWNWLRCVIGETAQDGALAFICAVPLALCIRVNPAGCVAAAELCQGYFMDLAEPAPTALCGDYRRECDRGSKCSDGRFDQCSLGTCTPTKPTNTGDICSTNTRCVGQSTDGIHRWRCARGRCQISEFEWCVCTFDPSACEDGVLIAPNPYVCDDAPGVTDDACVYDLRGSFTMSSVSVWAGCQDPEDDGPHFATGIAKVDQQEGRSFEGSYDLKFSGFSELGLLSGDVDPDGSVSVSYVYLDTVFGQFDSSGSGTCSGTVDLPDVSLECEARDEAGDTCLSSSTVSLSRPGR